MDLKQYVSEVQDWPKAGVSFKDITTCLLYTSPSPRDS